MYISNILFLIFKQSVPTDCIIHCSMIISCKSSNSFHFLIVLNDIQIQAEQLGPFSKANLALYAYVFLRAFEFGLRADPIMHLKPGTKFSWHVDMFHQDILWDGSNIIQICCRGDLKEDLKTRSNISGFIGLILMWYQRNDRDLIQSEGWLHGLPKRGSCAALPCVPVGGPDGKLEGCWCDGLYGFNSWLPKMPPSATVGFFFWTLRNCTVYREGAVQFGVDQRKDMNLSSLFEF